MKAMKQRFTWFSCVFLALIVFSWPRPSAARIQEHEMEQERLSGYKDQIVESKIYDRERLRSYRAYLESLEKELFDKNKALREFKKDQKKQEKKDDESDSYEVFLDEKNNELRDYENAKLEYKKNQKKSRAIQATRDFTEEEELGIYVERPRYDYKKRAMYGAKPKYKMALKGSLSGSGSNYSPPSPPDFATDSGYIPPPPPPMPADIPNEPFYDEIPPPPPPPPMPGDFNSGGDFGEGYIPPPPPPPPMYDGEF